MEFPDRVTSLEESFLNKWDTTVKYRIASGEDILLLNLGQPGFECPGFVKEAIMEANKLEMNNVYGRTAGQDGLREAVCFLEREMNGLEYDRDGIIITNGAKEALFLAFASIVTPGDEVIVITPCWPTYIQAVRFFGGKAVAVDADVSFHLRPDAIEGAITEHTRAIVINNPNNPTGAVYDAGELSQVSQLAVKRNLLVISDEVYGSTLYDDAKHIPLASLPGMRERTITIDGFSKALAMTGYRLGYAAGPEEIVGAMEKIKSNMNGNTNSFFQYVLQDIITNRYADMKEFIDHAHREYTARREYICRALTGLGIEYAKPQGAFYVFAKIKPEYGMGSREFALYLVEKAGVAVAPGRVFGENYDDRVRIQFSASMETLAGAIERMGKIS